MEIFLARTHGFCSGVANAINIVEDALKQYNLPIYVYHEIVHNTSVVDDFRRRGVIFVENIDDVPISATLIFSAHGVPPAAITKAQMRKLKIIDATCPLVTKVHKEATKFSKKNYHVVLIGHKGHQEIIGTSGYIKKNLLHIIEDEKDIESLSISSNTPIAYLTQTTLSIDDTKKLIQKLKQKFPYLEAPASECICYATQKRQEAVKELATFCDIIIICGSKNSSNSNRLKETGEKAGVKTLLIDKATELDTNILDTKSKIGISSGASVPRYIVDEIIKKIQTKYPDARLHKLGNK